MTKRKKRRLAALKGWRTRRINDADRARLRITRAQKKYEQTVQKKWEEDAWKLIVRTNSNIDGRRLAEREWKQS